MFSILLNISIIWYKSYAADWNNATSYKDALEILPQAANHRWYSQASNLSVNLSNNTVSISCDNGAHTNDIPLSSSEIDSLIQIASSSWYDVSVTPPAPVITQSSSTSYNCSSYLSSWSTSWSDCRISSWWSSNWTIQCTQTASNSPNYSSCWSQTCTTTCVDWNCSTSCSWCGWCPWNASQPYTPPATKTITSNLNNPNSLCSWIYANNSDSCNVSFNIYASTNQWKWITWWWSNWVFSNIRDISWEKSDRINNKWNALNFENVSSTSIPNNTSNNFTVNITWIKSRAPFASNNWKISLSSWWAQFVLNNVNYNFKKPFTWYIKTWNNVNNTWEWTTTIWTLNKYKLLLDKKSTIDMSTLANYSMNNFSNEIKPLWTWVELQSTSLDVSTLKDLNWAVFTTRLNTTSWASSLNKTPWLQVNLPIVSYKLWWEDISYYLSSWDSWNDMSPITTTWDDFMAMKIIWNLQWDWKSQLTWQEKNISDLSTSKFRDDFRKNVYNLIKSMNSWDILNWVKYVEWNVTLSWSNGDFETIIIKNWNLTIEWDLNTDNKKLWIIVLKDWYDVNSWYSDKWNIYIKPNVTKINWAIYADWWIISVDNNWKLYLSDTATRTQELRKQLYIKWSIFTRNTIWWAIQAWWEYVLPWWSKTSDFNKSMQYDLNYLRRWNAWCDKNNNWSCNDRWEYPNYFIIDYNSSIQTDPPKLFDN